MRDGEPYLRELIYQSHLTNTQLIDLIKQRVPDIRKRFYCDAAEPARIQDLRMAGINAMPADKSVIDGINHLKTLKLHIDYHSPNLQKEIRQYSYVKKGDTVLEEPVKFLDDALDSARYVIYSQRTTGRQPFRSAEIKAALDPTVTALKFKFGQNGR
jgi:phage terminase large subunit